MKKALLIMLSAGFNRAMRDTLERGVYITGGFGKDPGEDNTQSHFHVTTWAERFAIQHVPPQLRQKMQEQEDVVDLGVDEYFDISNKE